MKKYSKFWALALCLVMCVNLATPALAVGETNTAGIKFSLELSDSELYVSDQAQTVTATIKASDDVTIKDMQYVLTVPSGVTVAAPTYASGEGVWNSTDLKATWYASSDVTTSTLATIQLTIPANTVAGDLSFSVSGIMLSNSTNSLGEYFENGASATATLTITDDPADVNAYTASISADKTQINVNDTVTVTVNVDGTAGSFASSQIQLSYDPTYLTFDAASTAHTLNGASVSVDVNNVITIVDHGEAQNNGEAYKLVFTGKAATTTDTVITLKSAGFDVAANALTENLQPAVLTATTASIAISYADLNVTLSDDFTSEQGTTVPYGGDYVFTAKDPNYNYTVSVNDGAITPSYDAATGEWTITNVTTDLNISATKTEKQFKVTISDMNAINVTGGTPATGDNAAIYKTDYTFTLKDDIAKDTGVTGYTYTVTSITIDGEEVANSWSQNGRVVTINGDYITGDIVINTNVATLEADEFSVSGAANDVSADKTKVEKGGTVTLTWTPVAGYDYVIKVNEAEITKDQWTEVKDDEGNATGQYTYAIQNITSNIVIEVTKTLSLSDDNVSVGTYLSLDGKTIYIVQVTTKLDDGNVYTYAGNNMFWSAKYNNNSGANAFLVIMDNQDGEGEDQVLTVEDAIAQINISSDTATTIDYSGNVNMANASTVDANDAQLVYNMYQTKLYNTIDNATMMEKFLRADVNASANVDVEDATAIVNTILDK